jgi:amino acid transporter
MTVPGDSVSDAKAPHGLRANSLGLGAVIFFVVSAAGPLVAIAGGVPVSMLLGNGAGIPAMFALAAGILLVFAAGFTSMAAEVRSAGGFYAFAARGLGGYAGGATAAIAIFSYSGLQFAIYGLLGATCAEFVLAHTGLSAPWWVYGFITMFVVATLGYRKVDLSAKVLAVLVIGEYLIVLILDTAILVGTHSKEISFASFTPQVISGGSPWIGLLMCFAAFIGFEATTIYSEEARDPARTIPAATYISLLMIGVFYMFSSWCMVVAVGHQNLLPMLRGMSDPTAFVFQIAIQRLGRSFATVMHILYITSIFAGVLAFHNSLARYFFAMGREGLLHGALGRSHPETHSPHVASILQSVTAFVMLLAFATSGADPVASLFARASAAGTLGMIALMAIASIAVASFFWGRGGSPLRRLVLPVIAGLALVMIFGLTWRHFDALAGNDSPSVKWLPLLVPVAAVLGCVLADRLRRRDKAIFDRLGGVPL